jgi:hypothetical protein
VDFIIHRSFEKPIPIEVGRGKKDRKQITHAMNNYNAEYGINLNNNYEILFDLLNTNICFIIIELSVNENIKK